METTERIIKMKAHQLKHLLEQFEHSNTSVYIQVKDEESDTEYCSIDEFVVDVDDVIVLRSVD